MYCHWYYTLGYWWQHWGLYVITVWTARNGWHFAIWIDTNSVFEKSSIFPLVWLAPLPYYINLCLSFQIHWWNQIGVTVRKRSIWVKICDYCSVWPWNLTDHFWKTIGYLFYTTSGSVCHFKVMGEFKMELQSGNAQFGSQSAIFLRVLPWNFTDNLKTIRHLFHTAPSPVQHSMAISEFTLGLQSGNAQFGQIGRFLDPCDLEIWWMTLKNNRAPFLCCFNLCASFRRHQWIQTGVTVRNCPIWVKIDDFV